MAARLGAVAIIDLVLDPGSFSSWDEPPAQPFAHPGSAYAAELAEARRASGRDEAVITGAGRVDGRDVAVVVGDFAFLGGSVGVACAARIVAAVERATRLGLPVLAAPASGGTRMQEGTVAFVQMARIVAAVAAHKRAGLPYLVYLRHPSTGGVLASWGSLGHLCAAEPSALVGLLGPRAVEAVTGEPLARGVQSAENLQAHGLLDAVVAPERLGYVVRRVLDVLRPPAPRHDGDPASGAEAPGAEAPDPRRPGRPVPPAGRPAVTTAWEVIERSRRPGRPGVRQLLAHGAGSVSPLSGTGDGDRETSVLLALARFGPHRCVVVGQDRTSHPPVGLGPAGLRQALRGIRLAGRLSLPLVLVVDTPGIALTREAEESGASRAIADCLEALADVDVPTVSVLLGQGTGGGALALLPADRIVAAEHAWLAPLPPEGASAIIHRDARYAARVAEQQGVTAADLSARGIVDLVVPERPDAEQEPRAFCRRVTGAVVDQLAELEALGPRQRAARRWERYDRAMSATDAPAARSAVG